MMGPRNHGVTSILILPIATSIIGLVFGVSLKMVNLKCDF